MVVLGKTSLMTSKAFKGAGNLIKLLPSGTIFVYQFLSPVVTNNGDCRLGNKYLTGFLIGICGFSCFFSSFTDSYKCIDDGGETRFGVVTRKGLWPNPNDQDLSYYKLRFGDFVHACLSLMVFAVITMLDTNALRCYFPYFETEEKTLTMVLPPVVGAIASSVFAMFPSTRHGIGFGCALHHGSSLQEQLPK